MANNGRDAVPQVTEKALAERGRAVDAAIIAIEKQFGRGSIMKLGSRERQAVDSIPTGSIALDVALAGTWQVTAQRPSWEELRAGQSPQRVRVRADLEHEARHAAENSVVKGQIEAVPRGLRQIDERRAPGIDQRQRAPEAAARYRQIEREQQAEQKLDADEPRRAVPGQIGQDVPRLHQKQIGDE